MVIVKVTTIKFIVQKCIVVSPECFEVCGNWINQKHSHEKHGGRQNCQNDQAIKERM